MDIFEAIKEINIPFIKKYIDTGGNLSVKEFGSSLLHLAVSNELFNLTKILLKNDVDVDEQNSHGQTPLHIALWTRNLDIINLLISHVGNFDLKDEEGDTLVHGAVHIKNKEIFELFFKHKHLLTEKNNDGETPFFLAVESEQEEVSKMLLPYASKDDSKAIRAIGLNIKKGENDVFWNYLLQRVIGLEIKRR